MSEPQAASSQTPTINVAGLCKSFGSRSVLDDINFSLAKSQALCICGPNGAGKTTLLRVIAALTSPSDGVVQICGFSVHSQTHKIKPLLGAIFHNTMVYPQLTVLENLRFFARLYGAKNSEAHIRKLLDQTHLTPCRYDNAAVLSYGMLQRLAIARALVHKPAILLADEPFTGLDTNAAKLLVTILRSFKDEGGTVLMTTNNVNFPLECCQQVSVLDDRKLIFNAEVSRIDTARFARDYLLYARQNN